MTVNEELITLHIHAEDYDRLKSWQLASWCKQHGATDWTITAVKVKRAGTALFEHFDKVTAPFRLPTAKRRSLMARGSGTRPDAFIKPTELWRLNSASFTVLQEFLPDGLCPNAPPRPKNKNHSGKEGWFEDPVFYRNGEFMLGVVSHEREGIVRVTESERRLLEVEGFAFRPFGAYVGY